MATNKINNSDTNYGNDLDSDTVASRVNDAADVAREKISDLGSTASSQIDNSPLIAIGAGVALGAVLAAVLPASQREKELLAPLGGKIASAGNGAVDRARDISKQKFDEMAGDKVREFFGASSGSSKA